MTLVQPEEANIMICAWEWGAYLGEKTLRLGISTFQRPNPKSIFIEAKATGHYVNSILATSEAKRNGYDEALLLDQNGNIAEGPGANIFIEKNGKLVTPSLGHILPGITRQTVIELCRNLDIEIEERQITVNELLTSDSAFYCGTAAEIIGIASVDETIFPMRWSETLGASLQRAYKNLVLEKENYEVII
jgi:branched-chain amino acid aminotransferase